MAVLNNKFQTGAGEASEQVCGTLYAAKLLGLSVGTVQQLVEKNELKAWRTSGGHRRISMDSIRNYQNLHGLDVVHGRQAALKVLVVDDDTTSLEVIRKTMAKWDFPLECITMTSALEAIVGIGSIKPDVLVTDLVMPGVDGFELLRTLSANASFSSMLVIAMSGLPADEVKKRGGVPARTTLIRKPVDLVWLHGYFSSLVAVRQVADA
jgi:excisionase family DNA binding protein